MQIDGLHLLGYLLPILFLTYIVAFTLTWLGVLPDKVGILKRPITHSHDD